MKKTKVALSAIMILGALLYLPFVAIPAHAAASTVCLVVPNSTSCPTGPPTLTGATGTQLRIAVFLQGSNPINGFDITTLADHAILKPAGIDLTGSIIPSPQTILEECLGGVLIKGNTCQSTDTVDTLHLAVVAPPGMFATSTTGLLYTAIYNITSTTSGIPVGFQSGCSPTSVPPNTCVNLANGTGTPVPATIQTAIFTTSTTPDFLLTASPTSITVQRGSQGTSTVTLTSVNGFTGTIQLSGSIFPTGHHTPTVSLGTSSVSLSSGGTSSDVLTVSSDKNTTVGTYTVTVTATSGSITKSATITVAVTR